MLNTKKYSYQASADTRCFISHTLQHVSLLN